MLYISRKSFRLDQVRQQRGRGANGRGDRRGKYSIFKYFDIAQYSNVYIFLIQIFKVIAAAKAANIHNFVTALPAGYETNVKTIIIIIIRRMMIG